MKTILILIAAAGYQDDPVRLLEDWVQKESKAPGAPHPSRLYYYKAFEASLRGLTKAADYGYTKALKHDPAFGAAATNHGWTYLRAGDAERAAEILSKYAEVFPDNAVLLHNLGTANYLRKKYDEAIRWYERAAKKAIFPEEAAKSLFIKALAEVKLRRFEAAEKTLTEVLGLDELLEAARALLNKIRAWLWRKTPPDLSKVRLLLDYRRRVWDLKLKADDLAERMNSAIASYVGGIDRIMARGEGEVGRLRDMFRGRMPRAESPKEKYDPGCVNKPLGSGKDICRVQEDVKFLRTVASEVRAWGFCFGGGLIAAGLPAFVSPREWAGQRIKFRRQLEELYVDTMKNHSARLAKIIATLDRARAKPDEKALEAAGSAIGEAALLARVILMYHRQMRISVRALQAAFDSLLGLAEGMAREEKPWIGWAHVLHRRVHSTQPGFELALKRLSRANDRICDKNHRKIERLYDDLRRRGREHTKRYQKEFNKHAAEIDVLHYAAFRLRGDYRGLYETVRMTRGSVELMGTLWGIVDAHNWGVIAKSMRISTVACYVCSHSCGHTKYKKLRFLPFDITLSLCGTFSFKIGGEGELELKMGRGLFGSVFLNPGTLDYGLRAGYEPRNLGIVLQQPTNPDFLYFERWGHLPQKAMPFPGRPPEFMVPGKSYWRPLRPWTGWGAHGIEKFPAKKPDPMWSCGISLTAVPAVYVELKFTPEGTELALKGKIRAKGRLGSMLSRTGAIDIGTPPAELPIWQLWASPKEKEK